MALAIEKLEKFKTFEVVHVPIEQNTRDDILPKLASIKGSQINHSFIQETLKNLIIEASDVTTMAVGSVVQTSWILPIKAYIKQTCTFAQSDRRHPCKKKS